MLKALIKNELEKDKTLATKLSQLAGFKNATPLYKYLNESEREMDSLISLIKIVDYLFDEETDTLLNDYFSKLNPNGKMARQALEYASFNSLPIKEELVDKMNKSSNSESKEWASMYVLMKDLYKKPLDSIKNLNVLKTKSREMNALKSLMLLYCYYYIDNVHMSISIAEVTMNEIDQIKNNEYIKTNYYIRLCKNNAILYHYKNMIVESREFAEKVISMATNSYVLASAYQIKGMSYLYENFELGEELLLKAFDNYQKNPNKYDGEIRSSLNLNRLYWSKPLFDLRINGENYDRHDAAFYFAKNGDIKKAKEILATIDEDKLIDRDWAFQNYAKGLVYEDVEYYFKSIEYFKKMGDQFYINLPIKELRKKGFDNKLLDLLLL